MRDMTRLITRIAPMNDPPGVAGVQVPQHVVMRLVLIIFGLLLVAPPEAQQAGAEAVNRILDELGVP